MTDKKFWEYVKQMNWDHKKVLDFPEEDQLDFCKTAEEKQAAMQSHQTYCCDSAMDGSWGAVAWGQEHYEKLWAAVDKDYENGSELVCSYSHREGKSGEMLGYRIRALKVLLGGPEDHYDIDPPRRFAKLLDMTIEEVLPLWNKSIRPVVETVDKYLEFREENLRSITRDYRGEVDKREYEHARAQSVELWNEQYAEHVGVDPVVKTYKVRAVFLVEEDVEVKARSPFEALRLAEDWAAENAGEREVMDPHSMYHCEGWEVSEPTDNA